MGRRLAAILAADVVGYSKAMAADEAATLAGLKEHRAKLFEPMVSQHNGRVIKLMGDGTLVEFGSVVDAVECALAIQTAINDSDDSIQLRIGINLGDVMIDGDDVYGDGVNVAARLEALAPPGGICISDMVQQNIVNKLSITFEDAGEQLLKNIDRPVRTWRWIGDGLNEGDIAIELSAGNNEKLKLPDRPSIAVLPFDNMSGDPDQEYFSDGITEDIITELSRCRELFVIARNSSFSYKGKSAKVQDIGQDLGVAYIVEGSVRKAGNRVRITAQLIEAASGNHVWAERYDRELKDIFDLQDEITQTIVTLLPVRLRNAMVETSRRKPSDNLSAYDNYLHGRWLHDQTSGQDPVALELLTRAVELDPACAHAHAYIALAHAYSLFTVNPIGVDPTAAALASVERALNANDNDHFIHAAAGLVFILSGVHDKAESHSLQAVELNPNDIYAMLGRGYVVSYLGNPEDGLDNLMQALRYDPHTPAYFHELCAEACYMQRDHSKAIEIYKRWQNPPLHTCIPLAANYAQLGNLDEASEVMRNFEQRRPEDVDLKFYASSHARMCKRQQDAEYWLDGYQKIGLLD